MRRRIPYRVCRCLPNGVVTHLETRLLKDLVNREIHPIRCAESCKRKFQKAMYLGDLCAETGHFWWARKIWRFAAGLIEDKDYDDWRTVWFDNNRVRLRDVISETECELLDRRCSQLWRALGHPEYDWWDDRVEYLWHHLLLSVCRQVRWLLRRIDWRVGGKNGRSRSRAGNPADFPRRSER